MLRVLSFIHSFTKSHVRNMYPVLSEFRIHKSEQVRQKLTFHCEKTDSKQVKINIIQGVIWENKHCDRISGGE